MFFANYNRLLGLKEKYQSRTFKANEFTRLIRRQFLSRDFSFRTHKDYAVDPDMVITAGSYDCYYDGLGLPHTEITLCYHPEQDQYFGAALDWDQISFDVAECIGHELIHRSQHKSRRKLAKYISSISDINKKAEQEYLGAEEEIEAYGFSIAAESKIFNKEYSNCAMYNIYTNIFDSDHSVVVKLEEQIVKYLTQLTGA